MRTLLALTFVTLTAPALAAPASDAPAFDRSTGERIVDGLGVGLLATTGAFVGAFAGGFAGNFFSFRGKLGVIPLLLGAGGGLVGGFVGGASVYESMTDDDDGSIWAAAGGAGLGVVGAIGFVFYGGNSNAAVISPLMIPVGAGLGYALFDSTPAVPSVAMLPDGQGGSRLSVALSGTF